MLLSGWTVYIIRHFPVPWHLESHECRRDRVGHSAENKRCGCERTLTGHGFFFTHHALHTIKFIGAKLRISVHSHLDNVTVPSHDDVSKLYRACFSLRCDDAGERHARRHYGRNDFADTSVVHQNAIPERRMPDGSRPGHREDQRQYIPSS